MMSRIQPRSWADLGVLAALSLLGIVGFETSFGDYNFLVAGIGGLLVGTLAAVAATLLRLGALTAVLLGILAYYLVGTPLVMPSLALFGVLPSLPSLTGLSIGGIYGWADILTLHTPVEAPYYIAVLPYFAAWAVALSAGLLALRWLAVKRSVFRSSVLLACPALLYLAGILLGTDEPYYAIVRGVSFAAIALIWVGWRRVVTEQLRLGSARDLTRRRITGVAALVGGAILFGVVGGAVIAPAPENRFVLREQVEPPFDPRQFPSPLAGFRKYTKDLAETELFTVAGLKPGQQIRLATMDSYDGRLWNVATSIAGGADSGSFSLVGSTIPEPELITTEHSGTLEFEITGYEDVWLPDAGYPTKLVFEDDASAAEADRFRYNAATATAVLTGGVREGYHYRMASDFQAIPDDDSLSNVPVASIDLAPVDNVPDVLVAKALEYAGDATSPIAQLRAVEQSLHNEGFLSHGLASDSVPSRAGHGADRMAELFTRPSMVGDEEQYASAFALMARHLGYPARVVMGFAPEVTEEQGSVTVVGEDVTAWAEVAFDGVGWIPFNPTPEETDVPQDQVPKPQNEPQPQVRQPPRLDNDEEDLLTSVEIDDSNEEDENGAFVLPGWAYAVAATILIPALLYLIPFGIIAALKTRRRMRRRKDLAPHSVAGAWEELLDRYAELGLEVPTQRSRRQVAGLMQAQLNEQQLGDAPLTALAARVDADVFGGKDVPQETVDERWREVDALAAGARSAAGWFRRQVARFRIRRSR
ncbi:transglutaminase domain-containing protein [Diaminobutyricimonas sp. TR449]|uniref:transglutaminase family protein n=1 Tax=Diaminobutyricimonas sp. TR449 TaxID=2708076 RepID=UPI001423326C|nr:transglutaminase domain-containing protein [Diaminobutyricimonas sp. TR449]